MSFFEPTSSRKKNWSTRAKKALSSISKIREEKSESCTFRRSPRRRVKRRGDEHDPTREHVEGSSEPVFHRYFALNFFSVMND